MTSSIKVPPVVSIAEIERFLSPPLRDAEIKKRIEKTLKLANGLPSRLVSIVKLPGRLGLLDAHQSMSLADAVREFRRAGKEPAWLPYLLGYARDAMPLIRRELTGAHSIEAFSYPLSFSFPYGETMKSSFLCIRPAEDGLKIDVSEYIKSGTVNQSGRLNSSSFKTIIFEDGLGGYDPDQGDDEEHGAGFNQETIG